MNFKKILQRNELYVFIAIIIMALLVQYRSGLFFANNTLVDITRSLVIPGMLSVLATIVIVSGGIDLSFPYIGAISLFVVSSLMGDSEIGLWAMLLLGAIIGLVLGAINGVLIGYFRFNSLIVTLGTGSIFAGILFGALKGQEIPIPPAMYRLGRAKLFTVTDSSTGLSSNMPVTILFFIGLVILVWFILNKTLFGRGIYAVGGDEAAAKAAGFNIFGTHMFVYCFVGAMVGIIGVLRGSMILDCHPHTFSGMELTAIAAVVLGGAVLFGGKGTIAGTILGILLLTIIANSLILVGIPVYWQRVFIGFVIIVSTGASGYQLLRNQKKLSIRKTNIKEQNIEK